MTDRDAELARAIADANNLREGLRIAVKMADAMRADAVSWQRVRTVYDRTSSTPGHICSTIAAEIAKRGEPKRAPRKYHITVPTTPPAGVVPPMFGTWSGPICGAELNDSTLCMSAEGFRHFRERALENVPTCDRCAKLDREDA